MLGQEASRASNPAHPDRRVGPCAVRQCRRPGGQGSASRSDDGCCAEAPAERRGAVGAGVAQHRPGHHVGPHQRHRDSPGEAARLVRHGGLGRRVEDGERRHHVDADLRQPAVVLDRLRDARPVDAGDGLDRHRRERQRPPRRDWRRRLQEPQRRQDVDKHGAASQSEHIVAHPRRPAQLERGVRRPPRGRSGRRAASAGSTSPPTAAPRGRWRSRSTRTPASSAPSSTRRTPTSSTRRPTSAGAPSRRSWAAAPTRASTSPRMPARRGAS